MNDTEHHKKHKKPAIPASPHYTQAITVASNLKSDIFAVAVEEAKEWVDFLEL